MKTVFDKTTRDELIARINKLNKNSVAQWGKMNVYQVLKHCSLWEEMALGKTRYKQAFIGKLIGRLLLKTALNNPMRHNSPTVPEMVVKENGSVDAQKAAWIALLDEYAHFSNYDFIHPFFGKMSKEQIGIFAYKHSDHHLRQFNV